MKLGRLLLGGLLVAATAVACSAPKQEAKPAVVHDSTSHTPGDYGDVPVHHREILSRTYHIDKKYKSMFGPDERLDAVKLIDSPEPELLWITGYQATVVGADGE